MEQKRTQRVGFVIDIDGTVVLNGKPLPGAKQTLDYLAEQKIPYLLLTNNVARSEGHKAEEVSAILQLKVPLLHQQVVLNYTPIKHKFTGMKDGVVLIVGREKRLGEVLPLTGMEKYITVYEYCTLFPQAVPLSAGGGDRVQVQKIVCERLGVAKLDKYQLKVSGVVILTTPDRWQECYQVVIDVLSTSSGLVSRDHAYKYVPDHVPVMTCYNDMYTIGKDHNLPRLLMRPFTEGLRTVYRLVYGADLQMETYGKPHPNSYGFAREQLQGMFGEVDRLVMIGDNIEADIIGPMELGWDTILVKTGVTKRDFQGATINCDSIGEGVRHYLAERTHFTQ